MKFTLTSALAVSALLSTAHNASAGQFQYECTVQQVHEMERGALNKAGKHYMLGKKFAVSRETGEIKGVEFSLSRGQGWKQYQVLDHGSDQQAFKLIAISGGFVNAVFLSVKEYEPGDDKSFIYYDNFTVWNGVCR